MVSLPNITQISSIHLQLLYDSFRLGATHSPLSTPKVQLHPHSNTKYHIVITVPLSLLFLHIHACQQCHYRQLPLCSVTHQLKDTGTNNSNKRSFTSFGNTLPVADIVDLLIYLPTQCHITECDIGRHQAKAIHTGYKSVVVCTSDWTIVCNVRCTSFAMPLASPHTYT
jgi:hypothetical protein